MTQFIDPLDEMGSEAPQKAATGFVDPLDDMPQEQQNSSQGASKGVSVDTSELAKGFAPVMEAASALQTAGDIASGFNKPIGDLARGALQLALPQQAEKALGLAQQQKAAEQEYAQAKQSSPIGARLGYGAGTLGSAAMIPGGATKTVGQAALTGARAGGLYAGLQYTPEGQSRFLNVLGGMAGGAIGGGIFAGAGNLGRYLGKKIFARTIPQAEQFMGEAAKAGLKPTVGQVTGRDSIQLAEVGLSKFPGIGMKGKFKDQVDILNSKVKDFMQTLPKLDNTVGQSLKDNISKDFTKQKIVASAKYKIFNKELANSKEPVVPTQLQREINSIVSNEKLLPETLQSPQSKRLIDMLEPIGQIKQLSPAQAIKLRRNLQNTYEELSKLSGEERRIAARLKASFDNDLQTYAQKNPKLISSFQAANESYAKNVGKYLNDPVLSKVIRGDIDGDQILNSAVKNERPELVSKVIQNLNPKGRGILRSAIMRKAYNNSLDSNKELKLVTFSKNLDKLGDTLKYAFNKQQKQELKGIQTFMQNMSEGIAAGQAKQSVLPGVLGTSAGIISWINPITGAQIGLTIGGLSKVLASPKTSKLLIQLAKSKPGPARQKLVNQIAVQAAQLSKGIQNDQ